MPKYIRAAIGDDRFAIPLIGDRVEASGLPSCVLGIIDIGITSGNRCSSNRVTINHNTGIISAIVRIN